MKNGLGTVRRVMESRWFSGFATAIVLLGVLAAAGLPWRGVGESAATQSSGAGEIRVMFPGQPGPVKDNGWIQLESIVWGIQASPTRPPSGAPTASDVVIVKRIDAASLNLHQTLARGEHLSEITIELCKSACAHGSKYMQFVFTDAIITKLDVGGSTESGVLESVSFNYGEVEMTYFEQDKKGESTGSVKWDCRDWPRCVKA